MIAAGAVMFPIAFSAGNIAGRTLRADDIAGVSDLIPTATSRAAGGVSGQVTKNGTGIFGAHVVAFNHGTGRLVAGFTLIRRRSVRIAGLEPGLYIVRVEPLDDGDIESFFDRTAKVELGFLVTYAERLAIVPSGGNAANIDIAVRPK